MIIVTGSINIKADCMEEALRISQNHVDRSRKEPGCISHAVHIDHENRLRLVFFEQWKDQDALSLHFQEPDSIEFINVIQSLATTEPTISIFEAAQLQ